MLVLFAGEFYERVNSLFQELRGDDPLEEISIERLPPEDEEVDLPDFRDSFAMGVHSGLIRSFLPPRSYPHRHLASFVIALDTLQGTSERMVVGMIELLNQAERSFPDRSIISIDVGSARIYIPLITVRCVPGAFASDRIEQLRRNARESEEFSGSGGFWGFLSGAFAQSQFLYDGHDLCFLGVGRRMR
jgi:hypothetical protein